MGIQWGHRGKGPKHEHSLFAGTGGGRTAESKVRLAGEACVSPGWACDMATVPGLHSGSAGSGMGAASTQPSPPLHPDSPPLPAHQLGGCWCPLQSTAQALSFKLVPSSIPRTDSRGAVQTPRPGQEPAPPGPLGVCCSVRTMATPRVSTDDSGDDEDETASPADKSELHDTIKKLSLKLDDLSTCNELVAKHGVALQRSLSELDGLRIPCESGEKLKAVSERATLFRITSNAMINVSAAGPAQGPKGEVAPQSPSGWPG